MRPRNALLVCLGLLLCGCGARSSDSEAAVAASPLTKRLNDVAGQYIEKRYRQEQASAARTEGCDALFRNVRLGMRVKDDDPMAACAVISYSKTIRNNHEVWTWNDGSNRSVYIDNGIVTTINGTVPNTRSGDTGPG